MSWACVCARPFARTTTDASADAAPCAGPYTRRGSALHSDQWPNVLVHTEEVFRIVLGLELLQSSVVRSIRGRNRIAGLIITQIIDVPPRGDEGLHLRVCFAGPGDARLRKAGVHPFAEHEEVVALSAVRE